MLWKGLFSRHPCSQFTLSCYNWKLMNLVCMLETIFYHSSAYADDVLLFFVRKKMISTNVSKCEKCFKYKKNKCQHQHWHWKTQHQMHLFCKAMPAFIMMFLFHRLMVWIIWKMDLTGMIGWTPLAFQKGKES